MVLGREGPGHRHECTLEVGSPVADLGRPMRLPPTWSEARSLGLSDHFAGCISFTLQLGCPFGFRVGEALPFAHRTAEEPSERDKHPLGDDVAECPAVDEGGDIRDCAPVDDQGEGCVATGFADAETDGVHDQQDRREGWNGGWGAWRYQASWIGTSIREIATRAVSGARRLIATAAPRTTIQVALAQVGPWKLPPGGSRHS